MRKETLLALSFMFYTGCVTLNTPPAQTPVQDPLIKSCKLTPEDLMPAWAKSPKITTEIYVSSQLGLDTNSGLSKLLPLKTTYAALKKLAPGVRLNFMAGTYDCTGATDIANLTGGTASPAVINSVDGPRKAVFDCAGKVGFQLITVNGFIFEGIELKNTADHGIQLISGIKPWDQKTISSDFVVHNSYIHNTGLASVKVSHSKNHTYIGNEFAFPGPTRQYVETVIADNTVIAGNEAHDGSSALDEIKGGANGGIIFHNYIHDSVDGIYVGGYSTDYNLLMDQNVKYEATNVQVWDNKLVNISRVPFVFISCVHCSVANNTVSSAKPIQNALMINKDAFMKDGQPFVQLFNDDISVKNNIISSASSNWMIASSQSDIKTLSMTNNLWSFPLMLKLPGGDIEYRNEPTSLYQVSPGFVSATDLHLAPGSAALQKGVVMSFDKANWDNTCWGSTPNMGAF